MRFRRPSATNGSTVGTNWTVLFIWHCLQNRVFDGYRMRSIGSADTVDYSVINKSYYPCHEKSTSSEVLFSVKFAYGKWNSFAMKYCYAVWNTPFGVWKGKFYFTFCEAENFTIYEVNYFTSSIARYFIFLNLIIIFACREQFCKNIFCPKIKISFLWLPYIKIWHI